MKLEKINLNGEKRPLEVGEKVFAAKINNQLISSVIYRQNANFKGRKAKTKQKNEIIGSTSKIYAQKALVMQGMQVEKLQYLLEEV